MFGSSRGHQTPGAAGQLIYKARRPEHLEPSLHSVPRPKQSSAVLTAIQHAAWPPSSVASHPHPTPFDVRFPALKTFLESVYWWQDMTTHKLFAPSHPLVHSPTAMVARRGKLAHRCAPRHGRHDHPPPMNFTEAVVYRGSFSMINSDWPAVRILKQVAPHHSPHPAPPTATHNGGRHAVLS